MIKKKLALIYFTISHAMAIDLVLQKCGEIYKKYDVDVYFFDGSISRETEDVVTTHVKRGLNNLYYYSFPNTSLERRIEYVIEESRITEEYEYMWFSKDRSYFGSKTIQRVLQEINGKPHVIMLGVTGKNGDERYTQVEAFYEKWGWLSTSLDVLIYKTEGFINEIDYTKYHRVFGLHTMMFSELLKIKDKRVSVLIEDVEIGNISEIKSLWSNNIFKVWAEDWVEANWVLPKEYDSLKIKVIKDATTLPWILGDAERLFRLYNEGLFDKKIFAKYEEIWDCISNVPKVYARKIVNGEYDCLHDISPLLLDSNATIRVIAELMCVISEGKIMVEEIPHKELSILVNEMIMRDTRINRSIKNIIVGSCEDLLNKIECEPDMNELAKEIQLLTILLLVLK